MRRLFLQSNPPIILGPWTKISDTQYKLTSKDRVYYPYITDADGYNIEFGIFGTYPDKIFTQLELIFNIVEQKFYKIGIKAPDNLHSTGWHFNFTIMTNSQSHGETVEYKGNTMRYNTPNWDTITYNFPLNIPLSNGYINIQSDKFTAYDSVRLTYMNFSLIKT